MAGDSILDPVQWALAVDSPSSRQIGSANVKLVLVALACHADRCWMAFPSAQALTDDLGGQIDRRDVQKALRLLEDAALIRNVGRGGRTGRVIKWRLNPDRDEPPNSGDAPAIHEPSNGGDIPAIGEPSNSGGNSGGNSRDTPALTELEQELNPHSSPSVTHERATATNDDAYQSEASDEGTSADAHGPDTEELHPMPRGLRDSPPPAGHPDPWQAW
ncbi:hypothetical protein [Sinomonas soli]